MKFILPAILVILLHTYVSGQDRYDVVIDEIMADPTPQIGLPNNEWIELKNCSSIAINLQNWRIGDAGNLSGPMPNFILEPDSFVIVCSASALASMSSFGKAIAVPGFPSLDNDGDLLLLRTSNGKTMHSIRYTSAWYQNELKKAGGWTLEMIDTKSPCAGSDNWKASISNAGGTPGKKNSIDAVNDDQEPPQLTRAYSIDSVTINLLFKEPLDSLSAATNNHYGIDGGLSISSAICLPPLFDEVQLKLGGPLQMNTVYTVTVTNVIDCKNNSIGNDNKAKTGLPADASTSELIINEILFNPRSNGYDYVELYNKSNKILDASKLYIANRNSSNIISSIFPLNTISWLIFPGDYIVITEDADNLGLNYLVKNPASVLKLPSLPSFPNDKGDVLVLNSQGGVVDEVDYDEAWHFKLLSDDEGVSLERIDPDGPSQDRTNWHSAASTAGFGTPTYKNSQFKQTSTAISTIEVRPKVFSPDNDGIDDITIVQYQLTEAGYVANITIFDAAGRPVRNLVRNGTLGLKGYWNWDGLDDKGNKLPVGTYVIFTEIFNLQGKTRRFKNAIVLARRLQ